MLNHDKIFKIYFFSVKRQANNNFLKDVENRVEDVVSDQCLHHLALIQQVFRHINM